MALSEVVDSMPLPHLWSVLVFLTIIGYGFTTQYILVETGVTAIVDELSQVVVRLLSCDLSNWNVHGLICWAHISAHEKKEDNDHYSHVCQLLYTWTSLYLPSES